MRKLYFTMVCLACWLSVSVAVADVLRFAAWNLEHLDDSPGEGCIARTTEDYIPIANWIEKLEADVIAFQEVENTAAAHRVFPASEWDIVISTRRPINNPRECWDRPGSLLGHLATGFAVRKGINWQRHDDLDEPAIANPFQRHGTDISVYQNGHEIRLLSVHLRSGCWGASQDADVKRQRTCNDLRNHLSLVKDWTDTRRREGTSFVVLGDFNRLLAIPGDWGWSMLSTPDAPLLLAAKGVPARCDPRYPNLIDHIVAGGGADEMFVEGSFLEWPRIGEHPDHCAISADFQFVN